MQFRVFFKVNVQNGDIFGRLLKFLGVLEIPDIYWGEQQMLGPSLRMKKKSEYPLGGGTYVTYRCIQQGKRDPFVLHQDLSAKNQSLYRNIQIHG